ncbi:MAG: lipocalin family protein, partial [Candidatus Margulisiibacteriota bacterium]
HIAIPEMDFPRLEGNGTYSNGLKKYTFRSANAWMDREIFNTLLDKEQMGWDWFAIQLDNGMDIMAFQVRSETQPYLSATIVARDGSATALTNHDFQLIPLANWTSPISGISYPIQWRLLIPNQNIDLKINARFKQQELKNSIPVPFFYWEGQSSVSGTHTGNAYMELVGY